MLEADAERPAYSSQQESRGAAARAGGATRICRQAGRHARDVDGVACRQAARRAQGSLRARRIRRSRPVSGGVVSAADRLDAARRPCRRAVRRLFLILNVHQAARAWMPTRCADDPPQGAMIRCAAPAVRCAAPTSGALRRRSGALRRRSGQSRREQMRCGADPLPRAGDSMQRGGDQARCVDARSLMDEQIVGQQDGPERK